MSKLISFYGGNFNAIVKKKNILLVINPKP